MGWGGTPWKVNQLCLGRGNGRWSWCPPQLLEAVGARGPDGVVGWVWARNHSAGLFPLLRKSGCRGLKGGLGMQTGISHVGDGLSGAARAS